MGIMRSRLNFRDTDIPMALLFGIALCLAVIANLVAVAWIVGL